MAKTDVVKHDLKVGTATPNINDVLDPIPFPQGKKGIEAREEFFNQPPVATRVTDEERVEPPYRSVGRVVVITDADIRSFGSGWVVAPRAFVTAGHCVYSAKRFGGWISLAVFEPRYNATVVRFYRVATIYTLKGWVEDEDPVYDMAACVVTENFTQAEPPLRFQDGIFPPDKFTAIGYPDRPIDDKDNFNGQRMWKCTGEFIKESGGMWLAANDFTQGASGGPWCDANNEAIVYGITAWRRGNDPDVAQSPILLNGFENLYNAVKDM